MGEVQMVVLKKRRSWKEERDERLYFRNLVISDYFYQKALKDEIGTKIKM